MSFVIPNFPSSANTSLTNEQRSQLVWLIENLPAAINALQAIADVAAANAGQALGVAQQAEAKVDDVVTRMDATDVIVAGGDQFANTLASRIAALEAHNPH